MALFDFSNIRGLFGGQSPDGGWSSGTVTSPQGAFFSRGNDGSIAGITQGGVNSIGKAFQAAGTAMPGGYKPPEGAFAGDPSLDPNKQQNDPSQANPLAQFIAAWHRRTNPTTGGQ